MTHISLSHPHSSFASCLPNPPTYVPSHYYIYVSSYYLFLETSKSIFLFSPPLPLGTSNSVFLFFSSTSKVKSQRGPPDITSTVTVATATTLKWRSLEPRHRPRPELSTTSPRGPRILFGCSATGRRGRLRWPSSRALL